MLSERRKDKRCSKTTNVREEHAYYENEKMKRRTVLRIREYIALPKCETEPVTGGSELTYVRTQVNSVAVVRRRTIPTERPLLVGEVSANLCG
jgi:hypothetical protein